MAESSARWYKSSRDGRITRRRSVAVHALQHHGTLHRQRSVSDLAFREVIRLTCEQHAASAHIVSDVDEQMGQVPGAPEHAGNDDEPADLAKQRWDGRRALGV